MFIPLVGEDQDSLAQVLEIKTLIYTSVTLAFPRQDKGIRKKQYNLNTIWASCVAATPVGGIRVAKRLDGARLLRRARPACKLQVTPRKEDRGSSGMTHRLMLV